MKKTIIEENLIVKIALIAVIMSTFAGFASAQEAFMSLAGKDAASVSAHVPKVEMQVSQMTPENIMAAALAMTDDPFLASPELMRDTAERLRLMVKDEAPSPKKLADLIIAGRLMEGVVARITSVKGLSADEVRAITQTRITEARKLLNDDIAGFCSDTRGRKFERFSQLVNVDLSSLQPVQRKGWPEKTELASVAIDMKAAYVHSCLPAFMAAVGK